MQSRWYWAWEIHYHVIVYWRLATRLTCSWYWVRLMHSIAGAIMTPNMHNNMIALLIIWSLISRFTKLGNIMTVICLLSYIWDERFIYLFRLSYWLYLSWPKRIHRDVICIWVKILRKSCYIINGSWILSNKFSINMENWQILFPWIANSSSFFVRKEFATQ